ncbi:MAG: type II 3-dehydroquinate dehydratase [Wenzhouxiangellaceae bacterium]|nr:type II 3-dehydroquinate dehydratase [Wenzhouxiangellaceae bacterium]
MNILVLDGPNLNLLGRREPDVYGRVTLDEVRERLHALAESLGCRLECMQTNAEHVLVERIHAALDDGTDGILINPAALTHTSVALRDALAAVEVPFVEVHLSVPEAREAFRHESLIADLARGRVSGFGVESYLLGLRGLVSALTPAASE